MKITKNQLRRIIREEKARVLAEAPDIPDVMGAMGGGKFQPRQKENVEEGISRGVHEGVWNWLEAEFDQAMTGEDVWVNPTYTESIAHALEMVVKEIRSGQTP